MKTITEKSVKLMLNKANADQPTTIYLVFRFENKRFLTSTGQTILPSHWEAQNQRALTNLKNRQERQANESINAHLERQRSALVKVLNSLQLAQMGWSCLAGHFTYESLIEQFDKIGFQNQSENDNPIPNATDEDYNTHAPAPPSI